MLSRAHEKSANYSHNTPNGQNAFL